MAKISENGKQKNRENLNKFRKKASPTITEIIAF